MKTEVIKFIETNLEEKFLVDRMDIEAERNVVYLGLDSLDEIELVMKLESEFDIGIPDEEYSTLTDRTIENIADLVVSMKG